VPEAGAASARSTAAEVPTVVMYRTILAQVAARGSIFCTSAVLLANIFAGSLYRAESPWLNR
jgi:lipid A disaccharide synthetase